MWYCWFIPALVLTLFIIIERQVQRLMADTTQLTEALNRLDNTVKVEVVNELRTLAEEVRASAGDQTAVNAAADTINRVADELETAVSDAEGTAHPPTP